MKPTVIRIVDDDADVCDSLSCLLSLEGWEIRIYTDPKEFLAGDLLTDPGCLILDFRFPTTNGLEVQKVLIERQIRMPIIFLTAHGDIPLAVKAMQRGAVDFLTKPVDTDHLIAAIERALRVDTLHRHGFSTQADLDWTLNDLRDREKSVLNPTPRAVRDSSVNPPHFPARAPIYSEEPAHIPQIGRFCPATRRVFVWGNWWGKVLSAPLLCLPLKKSPRSPPSRSRMDATSSSRSSISSSAAADSPGPTSSATP